MFGWPDFPGMVIVEVPVPVHVEVVVTYDPVGVGISTTTVVALPGSPGNVVVEVNDLAQVEVTVTYPPVGVEISALELFLYTPVHVRLFGLATGIFTVGISTTTVSVKSQIWLEQLKWW